MKSKFTMARPAENLPSGKETRACDGTPGRKFTIRERNASLRWHARPKIYHPEKKSEFTMARPAGNLPSGKETRACDGTPDRKFTIRKRKVSSRWHARPEIYHPEKKRELAMARPAGNLPSGKETRACDGTPDRKFTIRKRKVSSRWHGQPIIYHPEKESEFTMARSAENVPSETEKQILDGTPARKCAIRNKK
jgi:hypothetical protein